MAASSGIRTSVSHTLTRLVFFFFGDLFMMRFLLSLEVVMC